MGLTAPEKDAGRRFRDEATSQLLALNEVDPPTYEVPFFLGLYRHLCAGKNSRSVAMELKEQYLVSPIYPEENVPAGRFGFIYREGRCRACGQSARSRAGRLVDGWERPPITGRVARS
jgi:hypothetical protein